MATPPPPPQFSPSLISRTVCVYLLTWAPWHSQWGRLFHPDLRGKVLLPLMTIGHKAGHYCHFRVLRSVNSDTGRCRWAHDKYTLLLLLYRQKQEETKGKENRKLVLEFIGRGWHLRLQKPKLEPKLEPLSQSPVVVAPTQSSLLAFQLRWLFLAQRKAPNTRRGS